MVEKAYITNLNRIESSFRSIIEQLLEKLEKGVKEIADQKLDEISIDDEIIDNEFINMSIKDWDKWIEDFVNWQLVVPEEIPLEEEIKELYCDVRNDNHHCMAECLP